LAAAASLVAAVLAIVAFFPPEGQVLAPVRGVLDGLLGHATFVLPLGLGLAGAIGFVRRARPNLVLPRRRLIGLGLITIALLPADQLLGQSTGLLGEWFTEFLLELLGAPLTLAGIAVLVSVGVALTFDLRTRRRRGAAR
jgi:hypothetical protein